MVLLSYRFTSNIVQEQMTARVNSIIDYEMLTLEAELGIPGMALSRLSESVRDMLIYDDSKERIEEFLLSQTEFYIEESSLNFVDPIGFYGYIESFDDGPEMIIGFDWEVAEDFDPTIRPWYVHAVSARGDTTETPPYTDANSGETIVSFTRVIHDNYRKRLGVIALDVSLYDLGQHVVDTALAQGGHGILLSPDLTIVAHPNEDYIGRHVGDLDVSISDFTDQLRNGEDISEAPTVSYIGEPSIAYFKKISNGWYLGLVAPSSLFYQSVTNMALALSIFGALLAGALMLFLISIDAAREKSDRESRYKSAFLANMSHEIRTPMNAIIGMTTIGRSAEDLQRKDYCLSKIDDASRHLLGVINDILDMSKIEANKFELSLTEFNFENTVRRIMSVINFRMEEKQHTLVVNIDSTIPNTLVGDDQRLSQVITNLLGNAGKFTPEKGTITLDAELADEDGGVCTLLFKVTDTGIGITPEQQEKLFHSFEQADADTTRKYGGTGLGLAICKSIVEMMDGSIWVESEAGEGSTFSFTVKLARGKDPEPESAEAHHAEDSHASISGIFAERNILLAEDVDINREIVLAMLEPTQVKIDCAVNGAIAVRMFSESPGKYEIILMDLQMPELDGYHATQQIRALGFEKAKTIPIIAMTANVFREDVERSIESGMNGHIGKPLVFDELLGILKKYLS